MQRALGACEITRTEGADGDGDERGQAGPDAGTDAKAAERISGLHWIDGRGANRGAERRQQQIDHEGKNNAGKDSAP